MCCFTGSVESVGSTRIFARPTGQGRQLIVYQMNVRAAADVAMILPVPVAPGTVDDDIRFISLEDYPEFFTDLNRGWPDYDAPIPGALSAGHGPTLRVHDVGDFEASFVPRLEALSRLDARFRLPAATWHAVPGIADHGFAVFKLRNLSAATDTTPHPMAFEYPSSSPSVLTFPTLHIHDGSWHETARFDHVLYAQTGVNEDPRMEETRGDEYLEDEDRVELYLDMHRSAGTVLPSTTVYRRMLFGQLANRDTELDLGARR